ncbi:MAG: hypothetical protein K0S27_1146 [Gammaproteobacteria bacterium]|nr:hypothetical protein [Gammaproteobacteria bacterium]
MPLSPTAPASCIIKQSTLTEQQKAERRPLGKSLEEWNAVPVKKKLHFLSTLPLAEGSGPLIIFEDDSGLLYYQGSLTQKIKGVIEPHFSPNTTLPPKVFLMLLERAVETEDFFIAALILQEAIKSSSYSASSHTSLLSKIEPFLNKENILSSILSKLHKYDYSYQEQKLSFQNTLSTYLLFCGFFLRKPGNPIPRDPITTHLSYNIRDTQRDFCYMLIEHHIQAMQEGRFSLSEQLFNLRYYYQQYYKLPRLKVHFKFRPPSEPTTDWEWSNFDCLFLGLNRVGEEESDNQEQMLPTCFDSLSDLEDYENKLARMHAKMSLVISENVDGEAQDILKLLESLKKNIFIRWRQKLLPQQIQTARLWEVQEEKEEFSPEKPEGPAAEIWLKGWAKVHLREAFALMPPLELQKLSQVVQYLYDIKQCEIQEKNDGPPLSYTFSFSTVEEAKAVHNHFPDYFDPYNNENLLLSVNKEIFRSLAIEITAQAYEKIDAQLTENIRKVREFLEGRPSSQRRERPAVSYRTKIHLKKILHSWEFLVLTPQKKYDTDFTQIEKFQQEIENLPLPKEIKMAAYALLAAVSILLILTAGGAALVPTGLLGIGKLFTGTGALIAMGSSLFFSWQHIQDKQQLSEILKSPPLLKSS